VFSDIYNYVCPCGCQRYSIIKVNKDGSKICLCWGCGKQFKVSAGDK